MTLCAKGLEGVQTPLCKGFGGGPNPFVQRECCDLGAIVGPQEVSSKSIGGGRGSICDKAGAHP